MPTTVMTTPSVNANAIAVCNVLLTRSRSPAPWAWDRMTVAPEAIPRKKPFTRLRIGLEAPTDASASVPRAQPTIMASTVL